MEPGELLESGIGDRGPAQVQGDDFGAEGGDGGEVLVGDLFAIALELDIPACAAGFGGSARIADGLEGLLIGEGGRGAQNHGNEGDGECFSW